MGSLLAGFPWSAVVPVSCWESRVSLLVPGTFGPQVELLLVWAQASAHSLQCFLKGWIFVFIIVFQFLLSLHLHFAPGPSSSLHVLLLVMLVLGQRCSHRLWQGFCSATLYIKYSLPFLDFFLFHPDTHGQDLGR